MGGFKGFMKAVKPFTGFGLVEMLNGGKNPAQDAMPYLNEIPGIGKKAFEPYAQQGQQADNLLNALYPQLLAQRPDYGQMAHDPVGILNNIMGQYEPSTGYQFRRNQLQQALGNTAAAGGFRGTGYDQMQQGEMINGLLGQDMQQFLENVLGLRSAGIAGLQYQADQGLSGLQGVGQRGYGAATSLADFLGSNLGQQANLAYQGTAQQNANKNALFNALLQAGAQGAGAYYGGKAAGMPTGSAGTTVPGAFKLGFAPFGGV